MRLVLTLVLLLPAAALASEPDVEALRAEALALYEKAAKELPFLATYDLLWNREITEHLPGDAEERYQKQLVPLSFHRQSRFTAEVLLPLLEHEDPKVRTLALVGVFALEDPMLLPHLAARAHDEAETFPEPEEQISYDNKWARVVEPTLVPRTVSFVARRMLDFYAERSGARLDYRPEYWEMSWTRYWEQRKERGSCAGWHTVFRDRRHGGWFPIRDPRKMGLQHYFHELRRDLPPVEQELTLLLLFQADFAEAVGERRVLLAARRLGPDHLMAILEGEPPTDDPDFDARPGDAGHLTAVRAFILRHAKELLRPSDAERLASEPDPWIRSLYPIARAELLPERAREILHGAFEGFDGEHDQQRRAAIVRALARTFGEEELEFLVAWFYTEPDDGSHYPPHRTLLTELLLDRWAEGDRRILAAIIRDPRFLKLDSLLLREIGRGLDKNLLERLFVGRELDDAWHPNGIGGMMPNLEQARRVSPVETANLLRIMADWRNRIRATLPTWAPASR